ncbi:MAG TPA: peptide chain release factor N(5)-glutamine methyltransferase [Allosphingosinicella sp.]|jgi:release factor glutamine methyltransferase|nr:peptide chain release factor N(5)-glutamine methyltransferase [Allosphingosinicella sp.]
MRVREALAAAAARLSGSSQTPRLDAELLMAHALDTTREALLLGRQEDEAPEAFEALLRRRLENEPVAYIIGRRAFWMIELEVGPGVLIPRPDSETLLDAAVEHFGAAAPATVLDLGTGPGTLLLAALAQWPQARGLGVDASPDALAYARRNAARLGLGDRSTFRAGDWGEGIGDRFDLVLCNPPYVEARAALAPDVARWEPAAALYAGADGLDALRRLAPQLRRLVRPGGVACVEIGAGQAAAAEALFRAEHFAVARREDLGGVPRCLILTLDRG